MKQGANGNRPFLWTDEDPARADKLRRGEILAASETDGKSPKAVPGGLIHDWAGAAFIPDVTLAQVFDVVRDYGRYSRFYRPGVVQAALLCRAGERGQEERFRVRYARKVLFVSEVLESEYSVHYVRVDPRRWYSVTRSDSLREFRDDGHVADGGASAGQSDPYIWRILTISKFENRDGGVYLEQENVVLSRPIPASIEWLVGPAIRRLAKDVVRMSLRETREAVGSNVDSHLSTALGLPPTGLHVQPVDRSE